MNLEQLLTILLSFFFLVYKDFKKAIQKVVLESLNNVHIEI